MYSSVRSLPTIKVAALSPVAIRRSLFIFQLSLALVYVKVGSAITGSFVPTSTVIPAPFASDASVDPCAKVRFISAMFMSVELIVVVVPLTRKSPTITTVPVSTVASSTVSAGDGSI